MRAGRAAETDERVEVVTCNCSTLQLQPPSTLCYNISLITGIATDSSVAGVGRMMTTLRRGHNNARQSCAEYRALRRIKMEIT
jgi:hypothetical protein